ncbi:MAG: hypothetical protein KKB20_06135 [Proteobacteria bacterium]|nr:hypothetical protein [Pseudomonadota bacterium]
MTRIWIVLAALIGALCLTPPARAFVSPEHYQLLMAEQERKQAGSGSKPSAQPARPFSPSRPAPDGNSQMNPHNTEPSKSR